MSAPLSNPLFTRVPRAGDSRLTYRRLRQPTRLPTMSSSSPFVRCIDRLVGLLGGR